MINKILLALLIISPILSFATDTLDYDIDSLIREVSYQYEIFPELSPERVCVGTLHIKIEIPERTEKIILYYTRDAQNPPRIFNSRRLDISGKTSVETSLDKMKPHSFFRVLYYIDGKAYRSSDFAIDDYIVPEDLEYLNYILGQNGIRDVSVKAPTIQLSNRTVFIKSDIDLYLTITTNDGKLLLKEKIDKYAEIPLDPGIFILSLSDKQNFHTKKILIK